VTVWAALRQPVEFLAWSPMVVVWGAIVSTMPASLVVRITPPAPTMPPCSASAKATPSRSLAVFELCAVQAAPPFVV
jgi:hypothetical protein